jgi:hypothetical protein
MEVSMITVLKVAGAGIFTMFSFISNFNAQPTFVSSDPIGRNIPASESKNPTRQTPIPTSTIDSIDVPYTVLEYAQITYQGRAIDRVKKSIRNNQEIYIVRVSPDTSAEDTDCIFLAYDMQWKLLGEEKSLPPEFRETQLYISPRYIQPKPNTAPIRTDNVAPESQPATPEQKPEPSNTESAPPKPTEESKPPKPDDVIQENSDP